MTRSIYLDCFSGVSGDMILGALVDAGLPIEALRSELAKLGLPNWTLDCRSETRGFLAGTHARVGIQTESRHRRLADVRAILDASTLPDQVKASALRVFTLLAEAEGRVHNIDPEAVHFHEVGGLDAIVDVVGTVSGLRLLGVERVFASPLPLGRGWVRAGHGWMPVPAPAVTQLLAAAGAPTTPDQTPAELVTPTGAAILAALATFAVPGMRLDRVGYGLGSRHLERPNALRALIGDVREAGDATVNRPERCEAIVLMAHGSREPEGNLEFLAFAERLSARLGRPVSAAFLELAAPTVLEAMERSIREGASTILAVPWLLVAAGHAKNDLPVAIQVTRRRHPLVDVRYGVPLGVRGELLQVLGDRLAEVAPPDGCGSPDTALLLVGRGSSDPEANADVHRAARILWEGRRFATVEVAFAGVTRPTVEEGLGRCLDQGVRRVVVLPYFLFTGVLVRRIGQTVASAASAHPEHEFRVARHLGLDVRLEQLAEQAVEQVRRGRASMTCDCCQYRFPIFGREGKVGRPPATDHAHGLRGLEHGPPPALPPRNRQGGLDELTAAPELPEADLDDDHSARAGDHIVESYTRRQPPMSSETDEAPAAPAAPASPAPRPRLRHHLSPRRERATFASLGFLVALIVTRAVTTALHYEGAGPDGGIVVRGVHVHHLVFGIVLVLLVGYAWLLLYGVDQTAVRWPSRLSAAAYGVAAALILDEFALWLNLRDVYWQRQGRESVEALAIFAGLLAFGVLLAPYGRAVVRHQLRRLDPTGGDQPKT